jgi:hypothetical protein
MRAGCRRRRVNRKSITMSTRAITAKPRRAAKTRCDMAPPARRICTCLELTVAAGLPKQCAGKLGWFGLECRQGKLRSARREAAGVTPRPNRSHPRQLSLSSCAVDPVSRGGSGSGVCWQLQRFWHLTVLMADVPIQSVNVCRQPERRGARHCRTATSPPATRAWRRPESRRRCARSAG